MLQKFEVSIEVNPEDQPFDASDVEDVFREHDEDLVVDVVDLTTREQYKDHDRQYSELYGPRGRADGLR